MYMDFETVDKEYHTLGLLRSKMVEYIHEERVQCNFLSLTWDRVVQFVTHLVSLGSRNIEILADCSGCCQVLKMMFDDYVISTCLREGSTIWSQSTLELIHHALDHAA